MAVMSVRASLNITAEISSNYSYDAAVFTERPYRVAPMLDERAKCRAWSVPNTGATSGRRVLADRTKTENIDITALPLETKVFKPRMIAGRWLLPGDEHAVVVTTDFLKNEPDVKLGDDLILEIDGRESTLADRRHRPYSVRRPRCTQATTTRRG